MDDDWTPPYAHDPNPHPPDDDPALVLVLGGRRIRLEPADLLALLQIELADCYIVSTGHGTSGPFTFGGVALAELPARYGAGAWRAVDVISADGFRTRLSRDELARFAARPPLLAMVIDGMAMTRGQGLVRLIVPQETDDALRQVKWVAEVRVLV